MTIAITISCVAALAPFLYWYVPTYRRYAAQKRLNIAAGRCTICEAPALSDNVLCLECYADQQSAP